MTNEEAIKIFKEVREEVIAKETELSRQVFENLGIKAIDLAIKALEQQPYKDWLLTFNTESATACYTAVQRLKESLNDRLDEGNT